MRAGTKRTKENSKGGGVIVTYGVKLTQRRSDLQCEDVRKRSEKLRSAYHRAMRLPIPATSNRCRFSSTTLESYCIAKVNGSRKVERDGVMDCSRNTGMRAVSNEWATRRNSTSKADERERQGVEGK